MTYVDGYVRTIQFYYLSIESVVSSLRVGKTGGGAGAGYGDGCMGQVPPTFAATLVQRLLWCHRSILCTGTQGLWASHAL